ncbi:MAG: flagellar assembly protein FliX [Beijerinckiaceae bacterium]
MRVDSKFPISMAGATSAKSVRNGRGFQVTDDSAATERARVSSTSATLGLDAVLALQGESETHQERRRRASRRGHQLLDSLEQLKLAVLDGHVSGAQLARLRQTLADQRAETGDARLDDLLGQIDLRAAVELAKLSRAPRV